MPAETSGRQSPVVEVLAETSGESSLEASGSIPVFEVGAETCEEQPIPIPVETATSKKFASSSHSLSFVDPSGTSSSANLTSSEESFVGKGYRLISCEALAGAVNGLLCPKCKTPVIFKEALARRKGIVSELMIICTKTACQEEARMIQDPSSSEGKALNTRAILGMRAIGQGRTAMESFCGMMDMLPPLTSNVYHKYNQCVCSTALKEAEENMLAASAHLHSLCSMSQVMKGLDIQPGPLCSSYLLKKDKTRLYQAQYRAEEKIKERRRKQKAAERVAEEAHISREGTTYGAGID